MSARHYSPTLPRPSISRIEPPVRPLRRRSFRARHLTNAIHQINVPWGERVHHSQNSKQGRGDILRHHIFVSFLGCDYALCGEGEILWTNARA